MTRHFCIAANYFFAYSDSLAGLLVHLSISLHISACRGLGASTSGFFLWHLSLYHTPENAFSFSGFSVYSEEQTGERMGKRKLILDQAVPCGGLVLGVFLLAL